MLRYLCVKVKSWLEGHRDETITFEGKLGLD